MESILKYFDSYERSARLYPALLVSAPVIITCYSFPFLTESPVIKAGVVVIPFVILMTYVVRFYGKRLEPLLWRQWGGAPSVRFLRKGDGVLAMETKEAFYQKIKVDSGIDLLSDLSDERLIQAFRYVRSVLYKKDSNGLWIKFNREYGYVRNLMGSRSLWVFMSAICLIACLSAIFFYKDITTALFIGVGLNLCCVVVAIFSGWFVFPNLIKGIAERYAENAILTYLDLD